MNKMGNPTGTGNPPGEYSSSYLSPEGGDSNFVGSSSYKNYGISIGNESEAGHEPSTKDSGLESWANKEQSI